MLDVTEPSVTVGPSILGLVTSGIYDDPLTVYREYIQNAADELSRRNGVEGKVEIFIDPRQMKMSICDNGPGLTYQQCLEELVPISQSKKCLGQDRGFRGIGRLSGLAFAESVTFLTRTSARDPVTRVVWTRNGLVSQVNHTQRTGHGFENLVSVNTLEGSDYPEHFFKVEIEGVSRHTAGVLLNRDAVRGYISEVCPVAIASDFTFSKDVQGIFGANEAPYSLLVTLGDGEKPIQRQYGSTIRLYGSKEDHFLEFEEVRVPSRDGDGDAAVGWIAHSSYLGPIPKANRIRGIRARIGNIQVGNERTFDHLFEEERFNRWCVGEMHILDPRIAPNARRDYFELNPHLRDLENHLAPIFRKITTRCRAASSDRNKEKRMISSIADIEAMYEVAASGFLAANDAEAIVEQALEQLMNVCQDIGLDGGGVGPHDRLTTVETKLRNFNPHGIPFPLEGISPSEIETYQKLFRSVARSTLSPRSAREIVDAVLRDQAFA